MLLGTLGASLLGNMLAGKEINRAGEGFIGAGYKSKKSSTRDLGFKNCQYRLILKLIFKYKTIIRMNLDLMEFILEIICLIKDGVYAINLDEYSDIGTHWIALYALNSVTYFDSFGV